MIEADIKPGNRICAPPSAPSSRPPEGAIDLAHLARMTLGEKSLEAEVLALFDRQAGILLERMRMAPPPAAGAFAHTLKGSAQGIGAWQVAQAQAPPHSASMPGMPFLIAVSMTVAPTSPSTVREVPAKSI